MFRKNRQSRIKNLPLEQQLFYRRALVAGLCISLGLLILGARLWYLQQVNYQRYATASRENHVNVQAVPPTRGLILDRNGVELAVNLPTYGVYLVPEQIDNLEDTLEKLTAILDLKTEQLEQFRNYRRQRKPFESIPLVSRLTSEETAKLAVQNHNFPGVLLKVVLSRSYPYGLLTAHSIGYVGRITKEDLDRLDADRYRGTYHTGKSGIEQHYESILHGQTGNQQVEVDAHGRVIRVLDEQPPIVGKNLRLSMDIRLQQVAYQALGDKIGSVVALDPSNGEILAMVSKPGFDPNLFVHGISAEAYRELLDSPDRPLFNRTLRGGYPPGSTIKPFIGLAGLEAGETNFNTTAYCPGFFQLPGRERKYRCWKRTGHGVQNLHQAIAHSCDVFFYQLANRLGIDRIEKMLSRFGFGQPSGLDLQGESGGVLPSREWKRTQKGAPWYDGETVITGIGQGFLLTTPLQLASATGMLSQLGQYHRPHLVRSPHPIYNKSAKLPKKIILQPTYWQEIITGMAAVFSDVTGTAYKTGQNAPWPMAGKSGTSQVFGLSQDDDTGKKEVAKKLQDHALFIAFAPIDKPKIAVAVIVENGGSGSQNAAPVARSVIDHYLGSLDED